MKLLKCIGCGKLRQPNQQNSRTGFESPIYYKRRKYCSSKCFAEKYYSKKLRRSVSKRLTDARLANPKSVKERIGSKNEYDNIHKWVRKNLGKAEICIACGLTKEEKRIEWANVNHQYRWNLKDWITLCGSCHYKFDLENQPTGYMFERVGTHFTKRKDQG
jgi:hypothetical protein